ncbi:mite group 2 allergen Gly d 2.02-like [Brevipalpus obovatus]|uniref:mite group 2 allergen Gly d 2.02-like n=1 Tax=Brevipalpus obovatus TaxID=246614 RepID=UPI003D9EC8B1
MDLITNFVVFYILVTNLISNAWAVKFRDCGNGEVTMVKVAQCPDEPCSLVKGKEFEVEMNFTPTKDAEKVTFHLSTSVFGFPVELPVDDNDACGQKFVDCPLKAGQSTKFVYKGLVEESVPMSSATVIFNLKTDDHELACIETDVELLDPGQDIHQEL